MHMRFPAIALLFTFWSHVSFAQEQKLICTLHTGHETSGFMYISNSSVIGSPQIAVVVTTDKNGKISFIQRSDFKSSEQTEIGTIDITYYERVKAIQYLVASYQPKFMAIRGFSGLVDSGEGLVAEAQMEGDSLSFLGKETREIDLKCFIH